MRNDYTPTKKLDSDNDDSIYPIKKHKNSSIKIITGVLSIIIVIAIIIILYKGNFLKHTSKRKASNSSDDYIQSNVSDYDNYCIMRQYFVLYLMILQTYLNTPLVLNGVVLYISFLNFFL